MAKRSGKKKRRRRIRIGLLALLSVAVVAALVLGLIFWGREEGSSENAALWDGGWYDDDLGCIGNDRPLIRGMRAFKRATGVRPYLSLLNGIEPQALDAFACDQYEALFTEAGHLLVLYDEWEEGAYYLSARGDGALSEADISLLLACIEKAYSDPANASYAEAFGAGFRLGAEALSGQEEETAVAVKLLAALGVLLLVLGVILVILLRKKALDIDL